MRRTIFISAVFAVCAPVFAEDQFSLATGFDYSTGKYGGSVTTDMLYIPVIAKYETDDLILKLTVPYLSVTGTSAGVIRGMGRMGQGSGKATTTKTTAKNTASGLGDIVAAAGYTVYDVDAVSLDLVGKVKLGTANANAGLGTGKNDYSAQVDGYYTIDKTTGFATAGYKVVGSPAGIALNNVAFGAVGASQKISDKLSAGVMLDVAQSSIAGGTGPIEVTAFVTKKLNKSLKVQVNAMKGLSNGSPDMGGGLLVTGMF
jgi:hypothetical protein